MFQQRTSACVVLVFCASVYLVMVYSRWTFYNIDLDLFVAGKAPLPFQYRTLTSWLARPFVGPLSALDSVLRLLPERHRSAPALFYMGQNLVCLFLSVFVASACIRHFIRVHPFALATSCLVFPAVYFNLVISFTNWNPAYSYDFPQLLVYSVALYYLLKDKFWCYLLVATAGTWNKETTVFLVPIYFCYFHGHQPAAALFRRCVLILAGVVLVKAHVYWLYQGNPLVMPDANIGNGLAVFNLTQNLQLLATARLWPRYLSIFGYLWIAIVLGWNHLPQRLRKIYWVCPMWFLGMLIVGRTDELRIFNELTPLVVLSVATILHEVNVGNTPATLTKQLYKSPLSPPGPPARG